MSDDNPFSYKLYGQPVKDMVIVTDAPIIKRFAGDATIVSDLYQARQLIGLLIEMALQAQDYEIQTAREKSLVAHSLWHTTLISYGRCFTAPKGRRKWSRSDIESNGGDVSLHEKLLVLRHELAAHFNREKSMVEVFAELNAKPGEQRIHRFLYGFSVN